MKILVLKYKKDFTSAQIRKLNALGSIFLEDIGKEISIKDIQIQANEYKDEEIILAVQPVSFLKDTWEGLPLKELEKIKNLKAICLATTSYSWIDSVKLRNLGVSVSNNPGKSTNAVAEYNMYLLFSLLKRIALINKNSWSNNPLSDFLGYEAKGMKAGIVGLGSIGLRTAELCDGLGMEVTFWNRSVRKNKYSQVEIDSLLTNSDVIFVTVAAAGEMEGFLNKEKISLMKPDSYFISTTHHTVYDKDFLIKQTENNKLAGFAFETEKPEEEKMENYKGNIFVSPEIAFYTKQTLENESRILFDTMMSYLENKPINIVN